MQYPNKRNSRNKAWCFAPLSLLCFALNLGAQTTDVPAIRVILVGDSTMATRTGYGDALCQRFTAQVECVNLAKGGRSTLSYRAEGSWELALQRMRPGALPQTTYVFVQFGHNDQPGKLGRSTDLQTEYPVNLEHYVRDIQAQGATPVLVTPLTRRSFEGEKLQTTLQPWADAMVAVANRMQVPLVDLHAHSARAVQAMGQEEADTLAMPPPAPGDMTTKNPFDRTHLGAKGANYFAGLMVPIIAQAVPPLRPHLRAD
nr:rhamnogalacturonan acetylesterase [Rhodoferax sp.]